MARRARVGEVLRAERGEALVLPKTARAHARVRFASNGVVTSISAEIDTFYANAVPSQARRLESLLAKAVRIGRDNNNAYANLKDGEYAEITVCGEVSMQYPEDL